MSDTVIKFTRNREYKYIRELSQGGCGKTVLLFDDVIDEHFVCKKYSPVAPGMKETLFKGFMNEIKLMHRTFHPNVVRIFSYYAYPRLLAGYIVMEYVEGETIDKHVKAKPTCFSAVFRQTIDAFCHLEECGILHRDIRPENILVRSDGVVKVIDLGFGKVVREGDDFRKSIILNWPYTTPNEFNDSTYDFRTEIYFVGKLFSRIMDESVIDEPPLRAIVLDMSVPDARRRIPSFSAVKLRLDQVELAEPEFEGEEVLTYREFADELSECVRSIDEGTDYITDVTDIITQLSTVHKNRMLEEYVTSYTVVRCFLDGPFVARVHRALRVSTLQCFLKLLKDSSPEKQNIILANLFGRLDAVDRLRADEIPF